MLMIESILASAGATASPLLFVWGSGESGNLANFDANGSPVALSSSIKSWTFITGGNTQVIGLRSDGLLFAWGSNNSAGALGLGNTFNQLLNSPTQIGTSSWIAVAAGNSHTLAIRHGGTLFSWGQNAVGELGLGDTIARSSPTQIGTSSWTSLGRINPNSTISAAIRQGGNLFTWGYNARGALASGDIIERSSPIQVGTSVWSSVAITSDFAMAIRQGGTLFAWGARVGGKLGNYINGVTPPTNISWRSLVRGEGSSFGIDSNYKLWAWGSNSGGMLGLGDIVNRISPVLVGNSSWTMVAPTNNYTLAIRSDNTLWSWGVNNVGQLGLNDVVYRSSPVQVGSSAWSFVAIGNYGDMSMGIRQGGTAFAWGSGSNYIDGVGNPSDQYRSSPTQLNSGVWKTIASVASQAVAIRSDNTLWTWGQDINGLSGLYDPSGQLTVPSTSWAQVASGGSHGAALSSAGKLFVWGQNQYGQVGNGNNSSSTPYEWAGTYSYISLGRYSTFAIDTVGRLWVVGSNEQGQLGLGDTINVYSPTQLGTSSWVFVDSGMSSTGAIRQGGTLFTWGMNEGGMLGTGDQQNRSSPTQIGTSSWHAVAMGWNHALGIDSARRLYTWGSNNYGQLGGTDSQGRRLAGAESWSIVSIKGSWAMGITTTGRLQTWGVNNYGQLGNGSTSGSPGGPFTIPGSWVAVAAGNSHALAVRQGGTMFAWGMNTKGQLGLDDRINRSSPVQVGSSSWTAVMAGEENSGALRQGGILYTWGYNSFGMLGDETVSNDGSRSSPVQVGNSVWSSVSWGNSHVMAIRQGGTMFAWGANQIGQIGVANSAGQILIGKSWYQVAAGGDQFMLAIDGNRWLWGWGRNDYGTLGLNDTFTRSRPTLISYSSWNAVSVGPSVGMAIRSDGRLFAWGNNQWGILGQGDVVPRSSPTQVGTSSWTAVALPTSWDGTNTIVAAAIRQGGNLFTWGYNTSGALGLNDTLNRSSPTQVGTSNWTTISIGGDNQPAAGYHMLAVRQGGTLFAWGANEVGQVGRGDTINRSSPAQIGTSSWTQVAGGLNTSHAIRQGGTLFAWGQGGGASLGLGNYNSYSSPFQVGTSSWSQIASSQGFANGIALPSGNFLSWGYNGWYAHGSYSTLLNPTVLSGGSWIQVTAGLDNAAGIDQAGFIYTNGGNNYWNMGRGDRYTSTPYLGTINDTSVYNSPTQIGTSSWTMVSAMEQMSMAIRQDARLFVWGYQTQGSLGLGASDYTSKSSPYILGTLSWSLIANGGYASAGITTNDGYARAWGYTGYTKNFTRYDNQPRYDPTYLDFYPYNNWSSIVLSGGYAGNGFFIAGGANPVNYVGAMYGAGQATAALMDQYDGQTSPVFIAPASWNVPTTINTTNSWNSVAAGDNWSYAARTLNNQSGYDGLWSWGRGYLGLLGLGDQIDRSSPTQVAVALSVDTVKGKSRNVMTRSTNWVYPNWLFACGQNDYGQIGDNVNPNTTYYRSTFQQVAAMTNANTYDVFGANPLAVQSFTNLRWWGQSSAWPYYYASYSQPSRSSPTAVTIWNSKSPNQIGAGTYSKVLAGFVGNFMVLDTSGQLFSWGANSYGGLGLGDTIGRSSPTNIGLTNITDYTFGYGFNAAARNSSGVLRTWGLNGNGQLGVGDLVSRSTPTTVSGTYYGVGQMAYATYYGMFGLIGTSPGVALGWGFNYLNSGLGVQSNLSTSLPGYIDGEIVVSPIQVGSSSWSAVGTGSAMTAAIRQGGSLFTWGINNFGSLGQNSSVDNEVMGSPVIISSFSYTQVSAGNYNVHALRSDGTRDFWGIGSSLQAGDGTFLFRSSPTATNSGSWSAVNAFINGAIGIRSNGWAYGWGAAPAVTGQGYSPVFVSSQPFPAVLYDAVAGSPLQVGVESWRQISSDRGIHTLAISKDGTLWAWGHNSQGNLGLNNTLYISSPVQVGTSLWTQVATGVYSSYGIRQDGALFSWGQNSSGQLGLSDLTNRSSPVQMGASSWSAVSAGVSHAMAISRSGGLYGWGNNDFGRLGLGNATSYSSPVQVGTSSWTAVSVNLSSTGAIRSDGTLWTWGLNSAGQLGIQDFTNRSSPVQVGSSSWIAVSMGTSFTAALRRLSATSGTLFAWGSSDDGVLGLGGPAGQSFIFADSKSSESFAIDNQYRLWAAGFNNSGQLGLGDTISRSTPAFVGGSWSMVSIMAATDTTYGIRTDGTLWAWGSNTYGELGQNDSGISRSSPVQIGTSTWSKVQAGYIHCVTAIRSDGTLWAWGYNGYGNLGLGNYQNYSSPMQVGTSSWTQISAGAYNSYALRQDGRLFAWGYNPYGGLGLNDRTTRDSPVQVGTNQWNYIGVGNVYSIMAIRSDNTLWSWGYNVYGMLGLGDTFNRSSPTQVGASNLWQRVAGAMQYTSWGVNNNRLYGWGYQAGGNGILGLNGGPDRSSPTLVSTDLQSFASIAIGDAGGLFVTSAGTLQGTGLNSSGRLGNFLTSGSNSSPVAVMLSQFYRESPVQVGTASWKAVSSGRNNVAALTTNNLLYTWGMPSNGLLGGPGVGSTVARSSPTQVGTSTWTSVNMGWYTAGGILK